MLISFFFIWDIICKNSKEKHKKKGYQLLDQLLGPVHMYLTIKNKTKLDLYDNSLWWIFFWRTVFLVTAN